MKGVSHIVVAPASVVSVSAALSTLEQIPEQHVVSFASGILNVYILQNVPLVFALVCGIMLILGALAPDTDSKTSLMGRFIHIPIEHRTYTHTIWVPLAGIMLAFVASFIHPLAAKPFIWFSLGYVSHLFWDSFSKTGFYWLYPLQQYARSEKGARIKPNHKAILYSTGSKSEFIVVDCILVVALILAPYGLPALV